MYSMLELSFISIGPQLESKSQEEVDCISFCQEVFHLHTLYVGFFRVYGSWAET